MNKLILIGNGFDLAHGLSTSYKDFLNNFWKNIHLNYKKEDYKKIVFVDESYSRVLNYKIQVENFQDFQENLISYQNYYSSDIEPYRGVLKLKGSSLVIFKFNNDFFQQINTKKSIQNWVDIENEYYSELKKITKKNNFSTKSKKEQVIKLNNEFEELRNIFEKYLQNEVVEKFDFSKSEDVNDFLEVSEILKPIIITKNRYVDNEILNLSKEFSYYEDEEDVKKYSEIISKRKVFEPLIFKSLVLSFNYTPTVFAYKNFINNNHGFKEELISCNYIHGELNSDKNKINFGFGDEIDSSYKEIEDIGDNEYLKNFKSFQYSNTQNYHDLLRYIDAEKFQVHILGHSCGLSDRVLLNTIFEHINCRSIKVYYYQKEIGEDNYTDIVQNISRHFNDKASMRRKIVNKELCLPLTQKVRFRKK